MPNSIKKILLTLNEKLLVTSGRNKLVNSSFTTSSEAFLFIDEIPQKLAEKLETGMEFEPLPPLTAEPKDETTKKFKNAVSQAKLSNETYLKSIASIFIEDSLSQDEIAQKEHDILRKLKDKIRDELGLKPLPSKKNPESLVQHAKNNNLEPSYDLPDPSDENINVEAKKYNDRKIQTLFLKEALDARLRKVKTKAIHNLRETGLSTAYICFGLLEYIPSSDAKKKRYAPLMMLPITFNEDKKSHKITSPDHEIQDNLTLRLLLEKEYNLKLPLFPSSKDKDELIDIEAYIKKINRYVKKEKDWRVLRRASIGIFYTHELTMFEDGKKIAENPNQLVKDLFQGSARESSSEEYDIDDPDLRKKVPSLIQPADASQHSAIIDMIDGKSFVLKGPPGTGKSQTICNMIAAGIGEGKKILFIAEKEAALEVVRSRLTTAGLDDFLLKVYSKKSEKKVFWESVKNRLSLPLGNYNEEEYEDNLEQVQVIRQQLNYYSNKLKESYGQSGLSNHDLLWDAPNLQDQYPLTDFNDIKLSGNEALSYSKNKLKEGMNQLERIESDFKDSYIEHIWDSAKKIPSNPNDFQSLKNQLNNWSTNLQKLRTKFNSLQDVYGHIPESKSEIEVVVDLGLEILNLRNTSKTGSLFQVISKSINCSDEELQNIINFIEIASKNQINRSNLNTSGLPVESLDKILEIYESINLSSNFTLPIKSKLKELENIELKITNISNDLESVIAIANSNEIIDINSLKKLIQINVVFSDLSDDAKSKLLLDKNILEPRLYKTLKVFKELLIQQNEFEVANINYHELIQTPKDYKKHALSLKNVSFFSFFSSDFWRAKSALNELTINKVNNNESSLILFNIAQYLEDLELIKSDKSLEDFFGITFDGPQTPFKYVEEAFSFIEKINNLNPKVSLSSGLAESFLKDPSNFFNSLNQSINRNIDLSRDDIALIPNLENINLSIKQMRLTISELSLLTKEVNRVNIKDFSIHDIGLKMNEIEIYLSMLSELQVNLKPIFNSEFNEVISSDLTITLKILNCFKEMKSDEQKNIKSIFINNLNTLDTFTKEMEELIFSYKKTNNLLNEIFTLLDAKPFKKEIKLIKISDLIDFERRSNNSINDLMIYFDYRKFEYSIKDSPQKKFYDAFKLINSDRKDLQYFFKSWLRNQQYNEINNRESNFFSDFKGKDLKRYIKDLKKYDTKVQDLTRKHIRFSTLHHGLDAPIGFTGTRVGDKTEMELLEHGASKKTTPRGSVRQHIKRASKALAVKNPCWLMTPANVSTFLPLEQLFDIVIIDEASQMKPPYAMGAIARSKQLIVVGDENQLPPSSFFAKADESQEEELDIEIDESILEKALSIWRNPRMLMWHYRSRHEDLIRFQNSFIYEDKLIIPPSTIGGDSEEMGVKNHYLPDALYQQQGINNDEAEKILEIALKHAKERPEKSLGIAVMNKKQSDLLNEKFRIAQTENPDFSKFYDKWFEYNDGLDKFFIKNLENVQGDERDVIILGTIYGKIKENTRILQRFGPVNQKDGHRRLNVITTRARDQLHLVTSLKSSEVDERSLGTEFLSQYLKYSIDKNISLRGDSQGGTDSPFEDWAVDQIKSLGFEPITQVGVKGFKIDIGVKHHSTSGYILGVECDGATYHSHASARDRDILRQELLESYDWSIHRIWSTDWIWEPEKTKQRLKTALEEALKEKLK